MIEYLPLNRYENSEKGLMNKKNTFIEAGFLKALINQVIILLVFSLVSSGAWAETPMSVLHYQGVANGTVQFDKVYCSAYPNAPETLDVSAPDMPLVRDGRLFGPKLSLVDGRKLEFVPDQYHQRSITTFSYDIPVNHPEIIWHKEEDENYRITFSQLKLTSYSEDGDKNFIYLSGEIYCNVNATESVENLNKLLHR